MGLEGVVDMSDEGCGIYYRRVHMRTWRKEIEGNTVRDRRRNQLGYTERMVGEHELPIVVSADDIKYKYLEDRHEVRMKKIHTISADWTN